MVYEEFDLEGMNRNRVPTLSSISVFLLCTGLGPSVLSPLLQSVPEYRLCCGNRFACVLYMMWIVQQSSHWDSHRSLSLPVCCFWHFSQISQHYDGGSGSQWWRGDPAQQGSHSRPAEAVWPGELQSVLVPGNSLRLLRGESSLQWGSSEAPVRLQTNTVPATNSLLSL